MKIRPVDRPIFRASVALAILVIGFALVAVLSIDRGTTPSRVENFLSDTPVAQTMAPVDVTGTWTSESGNTSVVTAKISDNVIEIDIATDGTSMSYWYGTFSNPPTNGAGVESMRKEHPTKMFLSGAKSKPFVYRDDKLSFEYSGMGITKRIELIRV